MDRRYLHKDTEYSITVAPDSEGFMVTCGSERHPVHVTQMKKNFYFIELEGKKYKAVVSKKNDLYHVFIEGKIYQLTRQKGQKQKTKEDAAGDLNSPISGKVVKVLTLEGDSVEKGQEIMVIEAMKMEYTIVAPHDGIIEKINFKKSEQVQIHEELGVIKENGKEKK